MLLPLLVWGQDLDLRIVVLAVCGAGLAISYVVDRSQVPSKASVVTPACAQAERRRAVGQSDPHLMLGSAVRRRLGLLATDGVRFGLVVLRVVRYEEAVAYYGSETAARMLSAVGRRGMRHLGSEAQLFSLGHGRVAFLFEIEGAPSRPRALAGDWNEPYDVEGMAMRLGRKTCERLDRGS